MLLLGPVPRVLSPRVTLRRAVECLKNPPSFSATTSAVGQLPWTSRVTPCASIKIDAILMDSHWSYDHGRVLKDPVTMLSSFAHRAVGANVDAHSYVENP